MTLDFKKGSQSLLKILTLFSKIKSKILDNHLIKTPNKGLAHDHNRCLKIRKCQIVHLLEISKALVLNNYICWFLGANFCENRDLPVYEIRKIDNVSKALLSTLTNGIKRIRIKNILLSYFKFKSFFTSIAKTLVNYNVYNGK